MEIFLGFLNFLFKPQERLGLHLNKRYSTGVEKRNFMRLNRIIIILLSKKFFKYFF